MDLETEPPQESKKDEDSIKDTLNELENEVRNVHSNLDDCATVNTSMKDDLGNGQQFESPNGILEDPSVETGNVHEEEEVIFSDVSDHFTRGSEHSLIHHHQSKSHSSGHCTAVGNPTGTWKGKDQEQIRASFEAAANPSSEDAAVNGREADSSIGTSQDLSPRVHVLDEEEAIIPHASNKFTHDPLGAPAGEHSSKHSRRRRSHSSGGFNPVGNPTRNGKDQKHSRTSRKSTSNLFAKGYAD